MAISKARKDELVAQYSDLLDQSGAIFLAEYKGLTVKQVEDLRGKVREAGGAFHITKNTLLRVALEKAEMPVPTEQLNGQLGTGFAMGEVPTLAKVLVDYAKDEDTFVLRGGIMDANMLSADDIEALAKLPSIDQLRAQVLGLINAPAQNIAGVVASGVRQVINVLDAYAKKDAEAEAEA